MSRPNTIPLVSSPILLLGSAYRPVLAQETASPFLEQVRANYAAWDLDKDNVLSANEVEAAVNNPAVKSHAAAAAALRRALRYYAYKSVTLEQISAAIPHNKDAKPAWMKGAKAQCH